MRDRAGYFYNNDKAARRLVPLRKAKESRRVRHENNQALAHVEQFDEAALDLAESSARQNVARKGGWRKCPSIPLGEAIGYTQQAREQRTGRKQRARESG